MVIGSSPMMGMYFYIIIKKLNFRKNKKKKKQVTVLHRRPFKYLRTAIRQYPNFIVFRWRGFQRNKDIWIKARTRFGFNKRHIRVKKSGRKFRFLRNNLRRQTIKKFGYAIKVLQHQFLDYLKLGNGKRLFNRLRKQFTGWFWGTFSCYLIFEYYLHFRILNFIHKIRVLKRLRFRVLKTLMLYGMIMINDKKIFTLLNQIFFFDLIQLAYTRLFTYLGPFFYRRRWTWFKNEKRYLKVYWLRPSLLHKITNILPKEKMLLLIHKLQYRRKSRLYKKYIWRNRAKFYVKKRRLLLIRYLRKQGDYYFHQFTWIRPRRKKNIWGFWQSIPVKNFKKTPFSNFFFRYYKRIFYKARRQAKKQKNFFWRKLRKKKKKSWRIFSKKILSIIPLFLRLGKRGRLPFKKTQQRFSRSIVQFIFFHLNFLYR